VKNMVASCSVCQENHGRNPKMPIHPIRLPDYAFQLVSADLFEFERVNYILLLDSCSKWPCVVPLKSTKWSAIIDFLCDFGRPEKLESDNGTQFSSVESREYCASLNIKQVTSSPEFFQSNGLVKRHIQTVKRTLLKMFAEEKSLWEALAAICSNPVSSSLPAPSVLLQGRNLLGVLRRVLISKAGAGVVFTSRVVSSTTKGGVCSSPPSECSIVYVDCRTTCSCLDQMKVATWCCKCGVPRATLLRRPLDGWASVSSYTLGNCNLVSPNATNDSVEPNICR
jgi:hypothetical protein